MVATATTNSFRGRYCVKKLQAHLLLAVVGVALLVIGLAATAPYMNP